MSTGTKREVNLQDQHLSTDDRVEHSTDRSFAELWPTFTEAQRRALLLASGFRMTVAPGSDVEERCRQTDGDLNRIRAGLAGIMRPGDRNTA